MKPFFKNLPWLLAVVALFAAYFFHSANQAKDVELAKLHPEAEEVSQLQKENAELRNLPSQVEEVARLKKENADLLKLRNEARRLRDESKQLTGNLRDVQARARQMDVAAQAQTTHQPDQQAESLVLAKKIQLLEFQRRADDLLPVAPTDTLGICIKNLQQIDSIKQQWALENKKTEQVIPTANDIAPYFKDGIVPKCPSGGVYTIGSVAADSTCSIPGHKLPPPQQ